MADKLSPPIAALNGRNIARGGRRPKRNNRFIPPEAQQLTGFPWLRVMGGVNRGWV